MAAVRWYMHIREMDDMIGEVSLTDDWPAPAPGMVIRNATFSSNPGDSPDVETPRGQPDVGGVYTAGGAYTAPSSTLFECIRATLVGTTVVGDHDEFLADGVTSFTLNLEKVDSRTDELVGSGTEGFMLCILGGDIRPVSSKFSMTDGFVAVTFIPPNTTKGMVSIGIVNDGHFLPIQEKVRPVLIF